MNDMHNRALVAGMRQTARSLHDARIGMTSMLLITGLLLMASAGVGIYAHTELKKISGLTADETQLLDASFWVHIVMAVFGLACFIVSIVGMAERGGTMGAFLKMQAPVYWMLFTGGALLTTSGALSVAAYEQLKSKLPTTQMQAQRDLYITQATFTAAGGVMFVLGIVAVAGGHVRQGPSPVTLAEVAGR